MSLGRIAFVVQRYGLEITGGSELHCREVAERMARHYDVDVLTTCAMDHLSWKNVVPAGESTLNGVTVRRFPTSQERHLLNFHKIYDRIFLEQLDEEEEHELLRYQGPACPELISYIEKSRSQYDAFIFFTYMYYTTVYGLPLVKEKAIFVPTAHDEASLYLHVLDEVFRSTSRLMFNTEEERFMLQRRFNLPASTGRIVGVGIDDPDPGEPARGWEELQEQIAGRQTLTYVGRVENGKGCDELVDFFLRFAEDEKRDNLVLLLIGKRTLPLPKTLRIISPGYLPEYVKYYALENSTVAVAPSPFESLCMAALESWMHRKALLANGRCPVLVGHCVRGNGGLWYGSYEEFRECLRILLDDERLRGDLGRQGRRYVESNYRWRVVEEAYLDELRKLIGAPAQVKVS